MYNEIKVEENKKFLPVGSVVLLKDAKKKVMITGFMITAAEGEGNLYDYSGCLYPEGIIDNRQTPVFNHDQIEKIFYLGYVNEEEKEFKGKLDNFINTAKNVSQDVIKNLDVNNNVNNNVNQYGGM